MSAPLCSLCNRATSFVRDGVYQCLNDRCKMYGRAQKPAKKEPAPTWEVTVITEKQRFTPYEGKSEQFARHDLETARHAILITGGVALINLRKGGALVESTNVYQGQYVTQNHDGGAR